MNFNHSNGYEEPVDIFLGGKTYTLSPEQFQMLEELKKKKFILLNQVTAIPGLDPSVAEHLWLNLPNRRE